MRVIVELFGAARDLSSNNYLELEIEKDSKIKDLREKLVSYADINMKGNENIKQIIKQSAFCSEDDKLISDKHLISNNQKIGIIPPIGGG